VAEVQTDAQGRPAVKPMPGFPKYGTVEVRYLYVADGVVEDNSVTLIITPDEQALWHRRLPAPLEQVRQTTTIQTIGTDEEIRLAINTSQKVTLLDKISVERSDLSADVHGYIEVAGLLTPVHYYVARNIKTQEWIVKPYDTTAVTK
jgi:hypothetical protein